MKDISPHKVELEVQEPRSIDKLDDVTRNRVLSLILSYRSIGMRFDTIAEELNLEFNLKMNKSSVHRLFHKYLSDQPQESLIEARRVAIARAEHVMHAAYIKAEGGSVEALKIAIAANQQMIDLLRLNDVEIEVPNLSQEADELKNKILGLAEAFGETEGSSVLN